MILLIDNYDSFTWNLYQYFCELGAEVLVRRNDALTLEEIETLALEPVAFSKPSAPRRSMSVPSISSILEPTSLVWASRSRFSLRAAQS